MRVGLTVSVIGHAAILGLGLIAFPEARPFAAEDIEALPVELVSVGDMTDLLKGDEKSKVAPEEKPQPQPVVEAPRPTPRPAEKVAEKPIEATPEPPPPTPEPEREQLAALSQTPPEAEPVPAPQAPIDAPLPRPRPNPPKPIAEPKPPTPERPPAVARPEPPKQEFNPDDIAALLNKQEPAGGGDPVPATEPQTVGAIEGHADAAMTQSEIGALKARLYRCWNPPVAVREAAAIVVEVNISLLPDGSLASPPTITGVAHASDPLAQVAAESAIRAVVQCAPFGDILRPEKYALWSQIQFIFDPREMLGG